jgi:hypothetical protein
MSIFVADMIQYPANVTGLGKSHLVLAQDDPQTDEEHKKRTINWWQCCQLALILISAIVIVVLIALLCTLKKHSSVVRGDETRLFSDETRRCLFFALLLETSIIRIGDRYGTANGGELTLTDRMTSIEAGWTPNLLKFLKLTYSNNRSSIYGYQTSDRNIFRTKFTLWENEWISSINVYSGKRQINNPYALEGTYLIVGLRFYTNQNRDSGLFGSLDGDENLESFPDARLWYIAGRALSHVDQLRFVWHSISDSLSRNSLLTV